MLPVLPILYHIAQLSIYRPLSPVLSPQASPRTLVPRQGAGDTGPGSKNKGPGARAQRRQARGDGRGAKGKEPGTRGPRARGQGQEAMGKGPEARGQGQGGQGPGSRTLGLAPHWLNSDLKVRALPQILEPWPISLLGLASQIRVEPTGDSEFRYTFSLLPVWPNWQQ